LVDLVNAYKRVKRGRRVREANCSPATSHAPAAEFVAGLPRRLPLHAGMQAGVRRLRSSFNIATFSGAQRPDGERI
jgi:hypothetical protein